MRSTRNTTVLVSAAVAAALGLAACGGSDDSAASEEEICDKVRAVADVMEEGDAAESEEEVRESFANLAEAMEDFVDVAPSDIKADAESMTDALNVLKDADFENPSSEVEEILDSEELEAAGDKVDEFAEETCDITIN